jgi:hypothetical protein
MMETTKAVVIIDRPPELYWIFNVVLLGERELRVL